MKGCTGNVAVITGDGTGTGRDLARVLSAQLPVAYSFKIDVKKFPKPCPKLKQ